MKSSLSIICWFLAIHEAQSLQLFSSKQKPITTLQQSCNRLSRTDFVHGAASVLISSTIMRPSLAQAAEQDSPNGAVTAFKLPSGLQYIELEPGTGPSPQYGQFASIAYTAYIQLPNQKKQQFDSVPAYLIKHGNGRTVPGLDEGLHTMRVGGKRRILIPPKLGYIQSGLGPLPVSPWNRFQLSRLLDQMVEARGGTLIMDVTLLDVLDDEADQGYYSDTSLSPEGFETLRTNMQRKAAAAAADGKQTPLDMGDE